MWESQAPYSGLTGQSQQEELITWHWTVVFYGWKAKDYPDQWEEYGNVEMFSLYFKRSKRRRKGWEELYLKKNGPTFLQ